MCYEKALAVYIDILGTKNSKFDDLYNINEVFQKELFKPKNRQILCQKNASSFSDCAYIIYKIIKNTEYDESFFFYIYDSLTDLAYTISTILLNGFLCRGGITYGELFFEREKNYLFGPAINKAYELETKATMPRIILCDTWGSYIYNREKNKIEQNFRKLIRKDSFDDRYYLNYLYTFSQFDDFDDEKYYNENIHLGDKEYNFNEYYNILKKHSILEINKNEDHNIIAKHKWQLRYLIKHKKARDIAIEGRELSTRTNN
jgi:hypothetical protein